MARIIILSIFYLLFCIKISKGQEKPIGKFVEEQARIGETVRYTLTYRHNTAMEILFPDSTFDFTPFELVGKQFFHTVTKDSVSLDSVVYELTTFELEKEVSLVVPVYLFRHGEKVEINPDAATLRIVEVIKEATQDPSLKSNTDYVPVDFEWDIFLIIGISGGLLLVALVVLLIFGKKIKRAWKLRKMRKRHISFVSEADNYINGNLSKADIERFMVTWKEYLSLLTQKPVYSYTTKEILAQLPHAANITAPLHTTDKAIYAGLSSATLKTDLSTLKEFAISAYEECLRSL
jgi:hypothetical protein